MKILQKVNWPALLVGYVAGLLAGAISNGGSVSLARGLLALVAVVAALLLWWFSGETPKFRGKKFRRAWLGNEGYLASVAAAGLVLSLGGLGLILVGMAVAVVVAFFDPELVKIVGAVSVVPTAVGLFVFVLALGLMLCGLIFRAAITAIRERVPHEHRHEPRGALTIPSLHTGAPVTVMRIDVCRCGHESFSITGAGHQQIGWGASEQEWRDALRVQAGLA